MERLQRGDTTGALGLAARAIERNPDAPLSYEIKGYYHYMRGEDSIALQHYRQALERGGASPPLHYKMGTACLVLKRWQDAHYHLKRALLLDSSYADAWVALGMWASVQGRLSEAEAYWKKALALDSTHDKARTFLYDLYLNDYGKPETARKYYLDPYWKVNRFDPLLNFQLGNYYLKKLQTIPADKAHQKDRATYAFQAVQAYNQAILGYPAHAQAHYNRGYVYFLLGKYDRALEDFMRATELNPRDARAHFMTASLLEQKGEYDKAITHYRKSIDIAGSFPEAEQALNELKGRR